MHLSRSLRSLRSLSDIHQWSIKRSLLSIRTLSTQKSSLKVLPVTGTIGAEIQGVQLSQIEKIDNSVLEELKTALWKYHVLFLHNQHIGPKEHLLFAQRLNVGPVEPHPIVKGLPDYPDVLQIVRQPGKPTQFGETWHTDNSYQEHPTSVSILHAKEVPPYGNDTVWCNMNAVYESLSPGLKSLVHERRAVHSASRAFSTDNKDREAKYEGTGDMKYTKSSILTQEILHPVIRTHPISKLKSIYVNSMFTLRFENMTEEESLPLLNYLYNLNQRPEFQVRFRWNQYSLAIWDNRSVQHIAIGDTTEHKRVMQRVTLKGERPI